MKKVFLTLVVLASITAHANTLKCSLESSKKTQSASTHGPLSNEVNATLDSEQQAPSLVNVDLNVETDKRSNKYIKIAGRKVYMNKDLAKRQVLGVVTRWDSKKIKTNEWDEVTADQYELDLSDLTLTYKHKVALFFMGPKRTTEEAKYNCSPI